MEKSKHHQQNVFGGGGGHHISRARDTNWPALQLILLKYYLTKCHPSAMCISRSGSLKEVARSRVGGVTGAGTLQTGRAVEKPAR